MPDSVKSKRDNERKMENSDHFINMALHKRRFSDILNDVTEISNRMLSKELRELEINQWVNEPF